MTGNESKPEQKTEARIPTMVKVLYTAFVAVLVPLYWMEHGPVNFLWFSNVALLTTVAALWLESSLLSSMMALAILVFETFWMIGFFTRLLTGVETIGLAAYMFDPTIPLFIRGLSLYHIFLPPFLLWLIYRLGYDRRALLGQTLLAWVILPTSYLLGTPESNENWVFGQGKGSQQDLMPGPLWVAMQMIVFPLVVYVPTHFALKRWWPFVGERNSH